MLAMPGPLSGNNAFVTMYEHLHIHILHVPRWLRHRNILQDVHKEIIRRQREQ